MALGYRAAALGAFAAAVVPETPGLARERGAVHRPGGLAAGLDAELRESLDSLQEVHGGPLARLGFDAYPYSLLVALLLDVAALELLVRGRASDGLARRRGTFPTRGPFSMLSGRDRLRALRLLEDDGLLPWLDDRLDAPHTGVVQHLAGGVNTLALLAYYSERLGEQGYEQAGYPGPAEGYRDFRGYEVESFEEDDYR